MLNALRCLYKLLAHSHAYPTRHATRGLFIIPKSRTDYGRQRVLHRAMTTWNSISHQVTDASSRIRFFFKHKNIPYGKAGTVDTHTHTCMIPYALYIHMDLVLLICGRGGVGARGHTECCEICECVVMFLKWYKLP